MSLYDKNIEEFCSYMESYFNIPIEIKQKIINEFIDGEVLIEFSDEDYKIFELNPFLENMLKIFVNSAKNKKKEIQMEEIIKKLNSFGIEKPEKYLKEDLEKFELKLGQKIMLKKYINFINSKPININSSIEDISRYFKEKLQISDESINSLNGLNGRLFFDFGENIFKAAKIKEEDKKKLMDFIVSQNLNKKIENSESAQKKINISDIEKKMKLEQMIIYEMGDIKFTMDTLYEKMKQELTNIENKYEDNKLSELSPYYLELSQEVKVNINNLYDSIAFDFSIANLEAYQIFITPIKGKVNINDSLIDIDIISFVQVNYIINKNNIIQPFLECTKCKKKNSLSYVFLTNHLECNSILIYPTLKLLELKTEKGFKEFFPKPKTEFNTPLEFEINFNDYFNRKKMILDTKKFKYYRELKNRKKLVYHLTSLEAFGNYLIFFGFSGIGKSIGIIYALKYKINHDKFKTLYIHCKHLYFLSKAYNYDKIKKILLNEIPFLFYNDYSDYKKCLDAIKGFKFSYKNTYIDLIEVIFSLLEKKDEKYIIVFDQYNDFLDPENKIYNLIMKILKNTNICNKFAFFSFMSLNNKDVKEIKIEKILNINQADNKEKKINIEEINDIFEEKFSNNKKQKIFEKVGMTIKNYNELIDLNEKKLNEYYQNKKEILKSKLIEFYSDESEKLSFNGMYKLMRISVGISYTEEEIKKLFPYINFKYFEIKKIDECYQIFYLSPIVEEVLKEIYYSFVYDNQYIYEKLLTFDLIKGGGKGCCFEQIVENILTPSSTTGNYIIPDLIIEKKEKIPHFLPRRNEVNIPFLDEEIELLKKKTYLIEQQVFGGKDIDFIIIEPSKDEHIIYAFQVSILKKTIFTKKEIEEILIAMLDYIKNFIKNIKVRRENLYFGYIFSLVNEKKPDFKSMINSCKKDNIPYSFLDIEKKKFLNKEKKSIRSIYEIVYNPYGTTPISAIDKNKLSVKRTLSVIKDPSFAMTKEIKDNLFKILKEVYNKNIIDIVFQQSINKRFLNSFSYDFFYTVSDGEIPLILINKAKKLIIYNLSDNKYFEIFNSLIDDDYLFDCYCIQFEGEEKKSPIYLDDDEKELNENELELFLYEKQKIAS